MKVKSLIIAIAISLLVYVSVFAQATTSGTVVRDANLRTGPGTTYAVDGGIKAGQTVSIIGQNSDKTWYQLADGHWIFAALVQVKTAVANPTATSVPGPPLAAGTAAVAPTGAADNAYTKQLFANAATLKLGADRLNANLAQVKKDNTLFVSPTWRGELSASLGLIDTAALGFTMLPVPPAQFAAYDKNMRASAQQLHAGISMVQNGLAQADTNLISQGATQGFNAMSALTTIIQAAAQQ